jgi:hypothetical protein
MFTWSFVQTEQSIQLYKNYQEASEKDRIEIAFQNTSKWPDADGSNKLPSSLV